MLIPHVPGTLPMKYSLRRLMIVVLVMPPLIAVAVWLARLVNEAPWRNVMTDPLNGIDLSHYGSGVTPSEPPDMTFYLPNSSAPAPISPKP